jgi:hypothetical protein
VLGGGDFSEPKMGQKFLPELLKLHWGGKIAGSGVLCLKHEVEIPTKESGETIVQFKKLFDNLSLAPDLLISRGEVTIHKAKSRVAPCEVFGGIRSDHDVALQRVGKGQGVGGVEVADRGTVDRGKTSYPGPKGAEASFTVRKGDAPGLRFAGKTRFLQANDVMTVY